MLLFNPYSRISHMNSSSILKYAPILLKIISNLTSVKKYFTMIITKFFIYPMLHPFFILAIYNYSELRIKIN